MRRVRHPLKRHKSTFDSLRRSLLALHSSGCYAQWHGSPSCSRRHPQSMVGDRENSVHGIASAAIQRQPSFGSMLSVERATAEPANRRRAQQPIRAAAAVNIEAGVCAAEQAALNLAIGNSDAAAPCPVSALPRSPSPLRRPSIKLRMKQSRRNISPALAMKVTFRKARRDTHKCGSCAPASGATFYRRSQTGSCELDMR